MRHILWSAPAERDLEAIDDYWRAYSPQGADRIVDAIEAAAAFLTSLPYGGPAIGADVRKWPIPRTDYILLYRAMPDAIEILRVHHGRQNWRGG